MNPFRQFVNQNMRWFRGHAAESEESLNAAQRSLGVVFPGDIKWLLSTHGYWHATGISSLDEVVTNTKAARKNLSLPHNLIVLYDHQDGGVILLDTICTSDNDQYLVIDAAWESVPGEIRNETVYNSYLEYVIDVLDQERSLIADVDIDYNPTQYRK